MKKLTVVDLFAGAGGMSNGFEQTGMFEIKIAVEINKYAQATYLANHPGVRIYDNIKELNYDRLYQEYGDFDVVIGGPPCQGFSNANRQHNNLICGNNQLVKEYIKAIEKIKPKAFVMENVKTIASESHKFFYSDSDFEEIQKLNIRLKTENINLGRIGKRSEQVLEIIASNIDIRSFLLPNDAEMLLAALRRRANKRDEFSLYCTKQKNALQKLLASWERLETCSHNEDSLRTFNNTKKSLEKYLRGKDSFDLLIKRIQAILEMNKVWQSLCELKENNVRIEEACVKNDCIIAKIKTYNVFEYIHAKLTSLGYTINKGFSVLNAAQFGVPQLRERLFIIGVDENHLKSDAVTLPEPIIEDPKQYFTIGDAIRDLAPIPPFKEVVEEAIIRKNIPFTNSLQHFLSNSFAIHNHIITDTQGVALERFKVLRPGQNFHHLDDEFKTTYSEPGRTQNTVYQRLDYQVPCGTVLNVRKSMWIHPDQDRAISVREAARLQSFQDSYIFKGTKDSLYQQIGNAVPPLLARAVAERLLTLLGLVAEQNLTSVLKVLTKTKRIQSVEVNLFETDNKYGLGEHCERALASRIV